MPIIEKALVTIWVHGVGDWNYTDEEAGLWCRKMEDKIFDLSYKMTDKRLPANFIRSYYVPWGNKVQKIQNNMVVDVNKELKKLPGALNWVFNKTTNAVRCGLISSVGDIVASFDEESWYIIDKAFKDTLAKATIDSRRIRKEKGLPDDSETLVMLLGHSLGSVIICKVCDELGHGARAEDIEQYRKGLRLNAIAIFGSPMLLWLYMAKNPILPKFPPCELIQPYILNEWAQRDPMSAPIANYLLEHYEPGTVKIEDKKLWLRGFKGRLPIIAHSRYTHSRMAPYYIARRVAETYKVLNN